MNLSQVKLILTDMDGTLLDENHQLPPNFYQLLEQLDRQHIYLAIASGRSYDSLMKIFKSPFDNLIFVCENGAHIVEKEQTIFQQTMPNTRLSKIIEQNRKINNAQAVLACKNKSYIENKNPEFQEQITNFIENIIVVDSLTEVKDESFKLCLFNQENASQNVLPYIKPYIDPDELTICSGSINWLDIMDKHINKGLAVKELQKIMEITPEETMVFGDHMNDYQMMQQAYFSFAMQNAIPEIKQIANFEAPHHNEHGVTKIIEQVLSSSV